MVELSSSIDPSMKMNEELSYTEREEEEKKKISITESKFYTGKFLNLNLLENSSNATTANESLTANHIERCIVAWQ